MLFCRDLDACVTPVLEREEAPMHPHNVSRKSFLAKDRPAPAPRLDSQLEDADLHQPKTSGNAIPLGSHTRSVLKELGYCETEINMMLASGCVSQHAANAEEAPATEKHSPTLKSRQRSHHSIDLVC